jgi:hypothetical protein
MLAFKQNAVLSDCGLYRYVLTRQVGPQNRIATFIMLNPSTADAVKNDQTIRKCIGFARLWECGRLVVVNLFAFRTTDPAEMRRAKDPVGPENKAWLVKTLAGIGDGPVVCGWGVHGSYRDQDMTVLGLVDQLGIRPGALAITKDGQPKHPLYVSYSAEPALAFDARRATPWMPRPQSGAWEGSTDSSGATVSATNTRLAQPQCPPRLNCRAILNP